MFPPLPRHCRLIAAIENSIRHVITKDLPQRTELTFGSAAGSKLPATYTSRLAHKLPFRSESYILSLHLPPPDPNAPLAPPFTSSPLQSLSSWPLGDQPHKLQEWFVAGPCLILSPDSYSGRILEEEEAHTLMSAGAAAISHLRLPWPLFIPVHDALRDAYRGVAMAQPHGSVVRLESDSTHGRSYPQELTQLSGQLTAFASRLKWHAPAAAAVCAELAVAMEPHEHLSPIPISDQSLAAAANAVAPDPLFRSSGASLTAYWAVRRCYKVVAHLPGEFVGAWETGSVSAFSQVSTRDEMELVIDTWDEDAVWRPWAAEDDPLGGLEVDALWKVPLRNSSTTGAATAVGVTSAGDGSYQTNTYHAVSNAAPPLRSATAWRLAALRRDYTPDTGRRPLILLQAVDQRRRFLRLQSIVEVPDEALHTLAPPQDALPGATSFAAMINAMVDYAGVVAKALDGADLSSDEWWLRQGNYVPPITPNFVLQDAIRDLFQAPSLPAWPGTGVLSEPRFEFEVEEIDSLGEGNSESIAGGRNVVGKAAPLSSLATRLALHALRLGNPRAVAMLWSRFLRELRFAHWEAGVPLPRMRGPRRKKENEEESEDDAVVDGSKESSAGELQGPDLRDCLMHQKVSLLDLCIRVRPSQEKKGGSSAAFSNGAPSTGVSVNDRPGSRASRGTEEEYYSAETENYLDASTGHETGNNINNGSLMKTNSNGVAAWAAGWAEDIVAALQNESVPSSPSAMESSKVLSTPQGVADHMEIFLLDFPDRKINIPMTQNSPPVTEDSLAEMAATSGSLAPDGASSQSLSGLNDATWARMPHSALLFSDMQAFKAANPGCRLEDFVRWHSPRDWVVVDEGHNAYGLSIRMSDPQGTWSRLWAAAAAIPASKQRPLFQASLEGERALHFLETLPPAAVYAELMALGFAAGVELLSRAPAAKLPTVAAQLARIRELGNSWLGNDGIASLDGDPYPAVHAMDASRDDMGTTTGGSTGTQDPMLSLSDSDTEIPPAVPPSMLHGIAGSSPAVHAMLHSGLSMHRMKVLVQALGCVEQTVAAGQSILQRLTPDRESVSDIHAIAAAATFAERAAEELVAAALEHGSGFPRETKTKINSSALQVSPLKGTPPRRAVAGTTCCTGTADAVPDPEIFLPFGTAIDLDASEVMKLGQLASGSFREHGVAQWAPQPFWTEWCIEIAKEAPSEKGKGEDKKTLAVPLHRFFVRKLPSELRVATVITSDMGC